MKAGSIASAVSANLSQCSRPSASSPENSHTKATTVTTVTKKKLLRNSVDVVRALQDAGKSPAHRRRQKARRLESRQGALPESRIHQRTGDRVLHPDRTGVVAAPARSTVDDEALPEWRRRGILLREELPIASDGQGKNGESVERG